MRVTRDINPGSRVGAVVRALAFLQSVSASIPGPGVICGLSLLVLYSAPRGFSLGTPVLPSPQKNLIWFYLIYLVFSKFDLVSPISRAHVLGSASARMVWDLRLSLPEDQAGVIHATSPFWMKLVLNTCYLRWAHEVGTTCTLLSTAIISFVMTFPPQNTFELIYILFAFTDNLLLLHLQLLFFLPRQSWALPRQSWIQWLNVLGIR